MKKITLGFSILAIAATLFTGCNKKTNPEPIADKEFQSSVDVSYANSLVTEVDMICGFLGETAFPKFFVNAPGSQTVAINNSTNLYSITWPANTKCMDGKIRTGSISLAVAPSTIGINYYRDANFTSTVTLTNYRVDGWKLIDSVKLVIKNNNTNFFTYDIDKLTWTMSGIVKLVSDSLPVKTMVWDGSLTKRIVSATKPSSITAISWTNAVVSYDGSFKGYTPSEVAYTYSINPEKPLIRNFTCSPDKVLGVSSTPSVAIINSEFHPFIDGVASFTTASLYPRSINYGTDEYGALVTPCDNSGSVTIKGISYKIDFKK